MDVNLHEANKIMKSTHVSRHLNFLRDDIKSLSARIILLTQRVQVLESNSSKSKNK